MSKVREYETRLMKILDASCAKVVDRKVDGAGHIVLTIECQGQLRKFHFAKSGATRGRNILNTQTRLKHLIAKLQSVEKPVDESAEPTHRKSS